MTPEALLTLAADDPVAALAAARSARRAADPALRVAAVRTMVRAGSEVDGPVPVERLLRRTLATAEAYGWDYASALARGALTGALAARGDAAGALAEAGAAGPLLLGADAVQLTAHRAGALVAAARFPEARAAALAAIGGLGAGHGLAVTPAVLTSAGNALLACGDLVRAETCLCAAATVAGASRLRHETAKARAGLAAVTARRGDLASALRLHAEAAPHLLGTRAAEARLTHAEILLAAGLPAEAADEASAALPALPPAAAPDAVLLVARAHLAEALRDRRTDGPAEAAAEVAGRARDAYAAQGREGWALLAERTLVRARWAAGERTGPLLRAAEAVAARLAAYGWAEQAADARIVAVLLGLELGRPVAALPRAVARFRTGGPAWLRAAAWHATAEVRAAAGDRRGALAAVRSGLRAVAEHAGSLGSAELRMRASALAGDLAATGLRLAATAPALLGTEETRRALAWPPAPDRAPADAETARLLAELRRATAARNPANPHTARKAAERALLTHTRSRPAAPAASHARADVHDLREHLEDRALLEIVLCGDEAVAVTVMGGGCRTWPLGNARELIASGRRLAMDVRLRAWRGEWPTARIHLPPDLLRALGDRELVLSPPGALAGIPWSAVPFLAGRPFSVTPSAAVWLRAAATPPPGPSRLLVAGPGAPHGAQEVAAIAALTSRAVRAVRAVRASPAAQDGAASPDSPARPAGTAAPGGMTGRDARSPRARGTAAAGDGGDGGEAGTGGAGGAGADGEGAFGRVVALAGEAATVGNVRRAMDGAGVAHVAAHGAHRAGDPLMSGVELADGMLLAHDLEGSRMPGLVVLSACDVGRADDAEAALGLASALLRMGSRCVVASVAPLDGAATRALMLAFHRRLAAGEPPAVALATFPRTPGTLGLQCLGAG